MNIQTSNMKMMSISAAVAALLLMPLCLLCTAQATPSRQHQVGRLQQQQQHSTHSIDVQPTVEWMSVNDVVDDFDSSSGSSNIGGSEDTPQRRVGVFSYIPSARLVVGAGEPAAKRARKMSAFMPMRGRRDPSADERSSAAADNDNSIPLDFNDASIQHQVSAAEAPARRAAFVRRILARSSAPINEVAVVAPNAGVMQAKLRRAFHPMRGRRSDPQIDALLRELAEINVD